MTETSEGVEGFKPSLKVQKNQKRTSNNPLGSGQPSQYYSIKNQKFNAGFTKKKKQAEERQKYEMCYSKKKNRRQL